MKPTQANPNTPPCPWCHKTHDDECPNFRPGTWASHPVRRARSLSRAGQLARIRFARERIYRKLQAEAEQKAMKKAKAPA